MFRSALYRLREADWLILLSGGALVGIGLAAIYSVALSHGDGDFFQVKKQLVAVAIGLVAFFLAAIANYRLLRNWSLVLYVTGNVLLLLVLIFGTTVNGTTGWFVFGPLSFQPVELMKPALVITLASYFSRHPSRAAGWKELLQSGAIMALPVFLTMQQPDLGSAALLVGIWGVLLLFAGLRKRYVFGLGASGIVLALLAWEFFFKDYQRDRILTFLDPSRDPLGQGYHVTQAIIAVGAGGLFGRGLGFGSQSQLKFIPESQTDFIFAVVAEELGFFGICLVLVAFFLLFQRIYRYASRTRDDFTGFLLVGLAASLFAQLVVNVGMNLGLLPVTGVTLPFVSYGGSSMIFTFWMLGIVESAAIHADRSSQRTDGMLE